MGVGCCKEEEIEFDAEVELSHFHLLRSVGKGAFGKVRVVQHRHSKILYALKYINKAKCIKMKAVENIIQERRLLEEIDYPLVCNLRYAFQDDENLFMVLDLMLGGDLRFHLDRQGPMKEEVVRFYAAEVSLGLDYLHSKKIVHRDLKPDNVLLDEKGHAHLTDFNIAVHFDKKPLTSVAGSMAYMAPEVLAKKGYYSSVDWWSLGVVMYELLFTKRPFRGRTNSALQQAILHETIQFPENVKELISDECLDFLKRLCERDISKRLGCGPDGIEEIKNHSWFKDIEWDKLDTKEAKAPFVPDSKRANFDATHELEELLLEDNPLKAKKRANPNQDLSELSKEMRMMEERFLIYDFTKTRRQTNFTGNNQMTCERLASKRRKSESASRSIGSVTAVERTASTSSSPINQNFEETVTPTLPPLALQPNKNDHEAMTIETNAEQLMEKNKGEWLNERPLSPVNRERRPALPISGVRSNGRSSPSDLEFYPLKLYPSGKGSSPSSPVKHAQTPPRIQPAASLVKAAMSEPVSPIDMSPSSSPQPQARNVSSTGSLRLLNTLNSQSIDILPPPPLPPPTFPLPPPPHALVPTNPTPSISMSTSSSKVYTLSPPTTNRRPPLTELVPRHTRMASDFGEGINASTTSGNSLGSVGLSSDHSIGPSRASGHFRSASDVSNGSGALSAVGVPAAY